MLRHMSDARLNRQRQHTDQAAGLRALMTPVLPQVRVVVAAHEAAVRQEAFLQLMVAGAQAGHRLTLLDGSRGELGRLLNLPVRYELIHVLEGEKRFDEVVQFLPMLEQLHYLPACRGLRALAQVQDGMRNLLQGFAQLLQAPDCVVVHGGPGLTASLAELADLSGEMIWCVLPRPEVITATYVQLKSVVRRTPHLRHQIWVHGVPDAAAADHVFANLAEATQKFFGLNLHYLGFTGQDRQPGRDDILRPGEAMRRMADVLFHATAADWHADVQLAAMA